jgi:antirestriction protein
MARIYVGAYAKYNAGSIKGTWLDMEDYADRDAFLEACRELHKDESDPEFMFQDFEGFPRGFYNESSAPPDGLWGWLLD